MGRDPLDREEAVRLRERRRDHVEDHVRGRAAAGLPGREPRCKLGSSHGRVVTSRGVILTFEEGVLGMEAYGWERSAETPHGAVYIGPGKKGRITINWNGIKDPYTISR